MRVNVAAVSLLAALSISGCAADSSTLPERTDVLPTLVRDPTALFQTDTLRYQLRAAVEGYEADIRVTFTNRSPATAYVLNCGGSTSLRLERLSGDAWVPAWSPVIAACLSAPIVVQPLERWTTTIHVSGGYPGCGCNPAFASDNLAGVYRLVFDDLYSSYKSASQIYSSQLAFGMRVSNVFALEPQPR